MLAKPQAPTLTVGDIASRLAPLGPDAAAMGERIRHWTREGLMTPVEQHHEGAGKHRRYAEDAVYEAAILTVLADAGLHVASARYLADAFTQCRYGLQRWKRAKVKPRLFLEIIKRPGRTETEVHSRPVTIGAELTIVVDLARIFAQVSAPR